MCDDDLVIEADALIEKIAGAIRDELDVVSDRAIETLRPEQTDPTVRVFRAVVGALACGDAVANPEQISLLLRRVATRKLATVDGFDADTIQCLLDVEPGAPDDWLGFLIVGSGLQLVAMLPVWDAVPE
jgi:hypothetical protein